MSYDRGEPVEFEFFSADATTAAPLVLRNAGAREVRTLESDERFVIENVDGHIVQALSPVDDITAVISADTDGDGDLDAGDSMVVIGSGGNHMAYIPCGMAGALGVIPKVISTAAGLIRITGNGYVMKG